MIYSSAWVSIKYPLAKGEEMIDRTTAGVVITTLSTVLTVGIFVGASLKTVMAAMGALAAWLLLCAVAIAVVSEYHNIRLKKR